MGHWRHAVLLCLWEGECWRGWTRRNDRCRPFLCVLKESDLKEVIWLREDGGKRGFSVFLLSPWEEIHVRGSWDSRHPDGRCRWWYHHLPVLLSLEAIYSFTQFLIHSFNKLSLIPAVGQARPWGPPTLTWLRSPSVGALTLVTALRGRKESQ